MNNFQKLLNSEIDYEIKLWKKNHNLNNIKKGFQELSKKKIKDVKKFEIKNMKLVNKKKIINNSNRNLGRIIRYNIIIDFLNNLLIFCSVINKKIPNMFFYIYLGDSYLGYIDYYLEYKYPIMVFSKLFESPRFLFPDPSFTNRYLNILSYNKKNDNKKNENWDEFKKNILKKCKNTETKDIFYFKGKNTGSIRNILKKKLNKYNDIKIILNNTLTPITKWCNYKYLFDLPGYGPWSFRFKEILLMPKSLTIKVDYIKYNQRSINFYNKIVKKNIDYIEIKIDDEEENYETKILSKINFIKKNPDKINKMMEHSTEQMKKLTLNSIYLYTIKLLTEYYKLFY